MSILDDAVSKYVESKRSVYPVRSNWPSRLGSECARQLLWYRTKWQDQEPPAAAMQRRFILGSMLEPGILRLLQDSGIQVMQYQRPVTDEELELSGRIDGTVKLPDGRVFAMDAKTAARSSFKKIQKFGTAAAMLEAEQQYIRGYVITQGFYARMMNLPGSLLFVVCKETMETCTIEILLEDPAVQAAMAETEARLRKVNAAFREKRDLPAEPGSYCRDCAFLKTCLPDRDFGAGVSVLMNEELAEKIARHEELKPLRSEYETLDDDLKDVFGKAGEFLVGPWQVIVKPGERTHYAVPEDVKKQYATKVPQLRRSYVQFIEEGTTAARPSAEAKTAAAAPKKSKSDGRAIAESLPDRPVVPVQPVRTITSSFLD